MRGDAFCYIDVERNSEACTCRGHLSALGLAIGCSLCLAKSGLVAKDPCAILCIAIGSANPLGRQHVYLECIHSRKVRPGTRDKTILTTIFVATRLCDVS